MFGLRVTLPLLFAQGPEGGSTNSLLLFFVPFLVIFYLLIIRPNRQQEQKRKVMLDALKKNDKVVTTGGIFGTVTSVDSASDRVVLRVDDEKGVKMSFTRSSVARVLETTPDKPAASTE
jgi:preprotein translocase subunit YajC